MMGVKMVTVNSLTNCEKAFNVAYGDGDGAGLARRTAARSAETVVPSGEGSTVYR